MGIPPAGGRDGGGGTAGCGDLCLLPREHSRAVDCDHAYYGHMSGSGVESGVKGDQAVLRSGKIVCGGYEDGGSGGGMDGG